MSNADFEIRIADFTKDHFALTVSHAPKQGDEPSSRIIPISKEDLPALAPPDLSWAVNSKDDLLRARDSSAAQSVERFGEMLFETLIWKHGDPKLEASWADFVKQRGQRRLRLVLEHTVPDVPWEALRDPHKLNGFLARQFSVTRYIPTSPSLQPLDIGDGPLRMLVVFADPDGDLAKASAIEDERTAIQDALRAATERGRLSIDFVEAGAGSTLAGIKVKVADHPYHIMHYFGHGRNTNRGRLNFEGDRRGELAPVGWDDLCDVLQPTLPSLRLVILNACELAQPGEDPVGYTPFTNLARSFLHAGVAMVVAMQYPIRTETATTFSGSFYQHLSAHSFASANEVEAAVVEGRKAIVSQPNAVEWITPVVFTRMKDNGIFRIEAVVAARQLYEAELWVEAAEKVKEALWDDSGSAEALGLKTLLLDQAAVMIQHRDHKGRAVAGTFWKSRFTHEQESSSP
jgi:hypothetical protein